MKNIKYLLPLCLLSIFLLSGCTNLQYSTFDYDGLTRQYLLYLPDDLPENAPLVFVLHGYTMNAVDMMNYVGMNRIADEKGFAVCYPQGLLDFKGSTHWNARLDISTTDDIGFLTSLAKFLQSEYGLSDEKTFSCGFSNGGFMSYTLACEAPDVFTAIASVAGTMSGYTWDNRNISEPTPILHIHGVDDYVVPIDGSMPEEGGWGGTSNVDTIISYWVNLNNCITTDTEFIPPYTNATYYRDGINGNEVWYYKIDNYWHDWPGGNSPKKPNKDVGIDASEVIWEFFSKY
ncbi:MAG: prolyl oligopeptidase family serine peptidase [Candidatus Thermoplasmatota archaeon]|nr:prolyl oligopeptidase family serine peptidase [Candidatus Thermoplasmatota archaeon]